MARFNPGVAGFVLAGAVSVGVYTSDEDLSRSIPEAAVSTQEAVASKAATTIAEAREVVASVLPARPASAPGMSYKAAETMANHEVGSKALYIRKFQSPVYPGASSGPTVAIGYDLGTQGRSTILNDWFFHKDAQRMSTASGLLGAAKASPWVAANKSIVVTWPDAVRVYNNVSLPKYYAMARKSFGSSNFDQAPQGVRDALTSVVYNRGASMTGSRRVEFRRIRDVCLPNRDWECVAVNLENQCHLWAGTNVYNGLCGRRKHEAQMARGKV